MFSVKLNRGTVPQGTVQLALVVFDPPSFNDLFCFLDAQEPVLVETFVIRALNLRKSHRISNPVEGDEC
jgi:hypothetical protein